MDEQQRTNEQLYRLNLIDVETYYDRKSELAVKDIEITERVTQAELKQACAVAAAARKQDDKLQAQARVLGLERELVELATSSAPRSRPSRQNSAPCACGPRSRSSGTTTTASSARAPRTATARHHS